MNAENPYSQDILTIPLDAIEYIIIRKEKELKKTIELLKRIYSIADIERILTKVQISENILRDFWTNEE